MVKRAKLSIQNERRRKREENKGKGMENGRMREDRDGQKNLWCREENKVIKEEQEENEKRGELGKDGTRIRTKDGDETRGGEGEEVARTATEQEEEGKKGIRAV